MVKTRNSVILSISIPEDLYKAIEEKRGKTKRSTYICQILKDALNLRD